MRLRVVNNSLLQAGCMRALAFSHNTHTHKRPGELAVNSHQASKILWPVCLPAPALGTVCGSGQERESERDRWTEAAQIRSLPCVCQTGLAGHCVIFRGRGGVFACNLLFKSSEKNNSVGEEKLRLSGNAAIE